MEAGQSSWWSVDRVALVALTLVGMAVCTAGIGKVAASGRWLSAAGVGGSLLGVAVLAIVGARVMNRPLPMVESDRAAIVAVLGVIALKVAIAGAFRIGEWA